MATIEESRDAVSNAPFVSVIVPFFNAGPSIEDAIAGMLSQTYSQWELLLVDDGSTDVSSQIARRYAKTHPNRVKYLDQPGHVSRGLPVAENLGLHLEGAERTPIACDGC
jgi:glycosyltransferase involved in cell wall biosynthesis